MELLGVGFSLVCLVSGKGLQMLQVSDHSGTSAVKKAASCDLWSWCEGMQEGSYQIRAEFCSFC